MFLLLLLLLLLRVCLLLLLLRFTFFVRALGFLLIYMYREREFVSTSARVLQRGSAVVTLYSFKPAAKRKKKEREKRIEFKNHRPPTKRS